MKFDDILVELGPFGKYQRRVYLYVCIPVVISMMCMVISVFNDATQKHRCAVSGLVNDTYIQQNEYHGHLINVTIPLVEIDGDYQLSQCEVYINSENHSMGTTPCTRWVYSQEIFEATSTSKFNLVCDDKLKTSQATMVFMSGVLVGAVLFGNAADWIGRKTALFIGLFLNFVSGMALAFAPNYTSYAIIRFFNGASNAGIFSPAFVLGMEIVAPSKRYMAGIIIEYFSALGFIILGGIAYCIRDWQILQIVVTAPVAGFVVFWWLIPESPRWLLRVGRQREAEAILRHAAQVNNRQLPEILFDDETLEETPQGRIWDYMSFFTNSVLLMRTLVIFFNWLVVSMIYYGLSLNSGNLGGDLYVNFVLSGLVEIPAYTICLLFLDRIGRKALHSTSMIMGGVACISTIFTILYGGDELEPLTITLAMIGKLGSASAFAIVFVYSAELFPTAVRNGAIGTSSMCARIGGILAPYIADGGKSIGGDMGEAFPLMVFGAASVLAGLMALTLPETMNKELPHTVQESIDLGRNGSISKYTRGVTSDGRDIVGLKTMGETDKNGVNT